MPTGDRTTKRQQELVAESVQFTANSNARQGKTFEPRTGTRFGTTRNDPGWTKEQLKIYTKDIEKYDEEESIDNSEKEVENDKLGEMKLPKVTQVLEPKKSVSIAQGVKRTKKLNKKRSIKKKNPKNKTQKGGANENKGVLYEKKIACIVDSSFAGATHDVADAYLKTGDAINTSVEPIEVKLSLGADFGQMNLNWSDAENGFVYSGGNDEMKKLYNTFRFTEDGVTYTLLDYINSANIWGSYGKPEKFNITKSSTLTDKIVAWEQDRKKYKNIFIPIPFETIGKFYKNKQFSTPGGNKTNNLIQIGHSNAAKNLTSSSLSVKCKIDKSQKVANSSKSLGLYRFKDTPFDFDPDIPVLSTSKKLNGQKICRLRLRFKTGKSGDLKKNKSPNWSFTLALICNGVNKSNKLLDDSSRIPNNCELVTDHL